MPHRFTIGVEEEFRITTILADGTSADRQLRVYRDTGDLTAVVQHVVRETIAFPHSSVGQPSPGSSASHADRGTPSAEPRQVPQP